MNTKSKTSFQLPSGFSRIAVAAVSIGLLLHIIGLSQKEMVGAGSFKDAKGELWPKLGWKEMSKKVQGVGTYSDVIKLLKSLIVVAERGGYEAGAQNDLLVAFELMKDLGCVFIAFHIMGVLLAATTCVFGFLSTRNNKGNPRTFVGCALICCIVANGVFFYGANNLYAVFSDTQGVERHFPNPAKGMWFLMATNILYIVGLYFGHKRSPVNNQVKVYRAQLPTSTVQVTQVPLKAAPSQMVQAPVTAQPVAVTVCSN